MKAKFLFLFLFLICTFSFGYDQINYWDKTNIKGDNILFDGKNFYFGKEKTDFDNNKISFISMNLSSNSTQAKDSNLDNISPSELIKRGEILQKKYPDSSILVLLDDGIEKLNKDGTRYTHSRYSVKILKEDSLTYSQLTYYNTQSIHESKILMARSIAPDGTINYLAEKNITYTEPKQGLSFFSGRRDVKIMQATIPDVKVGSIIDYEWETIDSAPEDPNQFFTHWNFSGTEPVYESKVKYIVPENKDFFYVVKNFPTNVDKPEITIKDGYKTFAFRLGESSPVLKEILSPPIEELVAFVQGSTFKNQDYLSNWLAKLMKERMVSNDKMRETVNSLITSNNAKIDEEKTAVLYRFMQDYIHYRSIKTSLSSGFSGHPAIDTFNNKYGDCIDKSILFATLLEIAGVKAYPVIIMTNDNPNPLYGEIGVISGNHAINEIHLKDKIIFLDSTSTTYKYPLFRDDDQGINAWNPILNTIRYIDPTTASTNTQTYSLEIKLEADGSGKIKKINNYAGSYDAGIREYIQSIKDIELKSLLRNMVADEYPGSVLKNYKSSNPADYSVNQSLSYEYESQNIAKKIGNFLVMKLPLKYNFSFTNLTERKYPLVYDTTYGEINKIEITLPENYKIKGMPDPILIKSKYFTYEAKYTFKNGKILFEDKYDRSGTKILPDDYKTFREDVLKLDYFAKTPIIFENSK
jgi:transglutaminase-like putative cysteine protease